MALPQVASTPTVVPGDTLTAAPLSFFNSIGATAQQVTWFRAGIPFASEGPNYVVNVSDIGTTIYAAGSVSWSDTCRTETAAAGSPPVDVVSPSVVILTARQPSRAGTKVRAKVKQLGDSTAQGLLEVTWKGSRKGRATVTLRPSAEGAATVNLPSLPRGTYRIAATFTDTTGYARNDVSPTLTVRVR